MHAHKEQQILNMGHFFNLANFFCYREQVKYLKQILVLFESMNKKFKRHTFFASVNNF